MFLTDAGRELKSWGPLTWNVCSLNVWIDFLACLLMADILHLLPNLPLFGIVSIPQLGAIPSSIFQV